ncbi:MAG: riboflavin synthase, partial [Deltaproteobacteria bacterium]|nr:riboflavin synthase [Deltaproteobacteria bacterium]
SIAVNGVCLTVIRVHDGGFDADVSSETLSVSTLGGMVPGRRVNVERSLAVGDRLGGHLVLGHVDGVGEVRAIERVGDAWRIAVAAPDALARFIAPKGSITVDGVSLTVNRVDGARFELMIVPHTFSVTILGGWVVGTRVNLEVDVLARYVARQLDVLFPGREVDGKHAADESLLSKLKEAGYTP